MAPEQARGAAVDKRTDIWAFGACLYEALTGRKAFGEPTVSDSVAAVLTRAPAWELLPAAVPASVRSLLERCLERDPRLRLRDIGEARIELDRLYRSSDAAERAESGPSATDGPPAAEHRRERRLRLTVWIGAVVVAVGLVWWLVGAIERSEPVVVVMDTTSPIGIYDPATVARGETNADELTRVLADLPVRVVKENASPLWDREHQVALEEPDLVIAHISAFVYPYSLSSFEEFRPLCELIAERTGASLRDLGNNKIIAFFGYLMEHHPTTRVLVYSRGGFADPKRTKELLAAWEGRFPQLTGKITTYNVERLPPKKPDEEGYASWSDPETAAGLRKLVIDILDLD